MKDRIISFIIFFNLVAFAVCGQKVTADFDLLPQACLNQNLIFTNQSTNADRFEYDLCQGDLQLTPNATTAVTLGGSVTTGVDIVFDGTNWFGFVTSQNTNSILRLDFGIDIKSTPTIINLGNIGNKINSPTDIKVIKEGNNWYGIVYGLSDPLLARIDFGSSLTNTTTTSTPITAASIMSGAGSVNGGFDMMYDGTHWIIVLTLNSSFTIVRLPLIDSIPGPGDVISGISNPFGSALGDLVLFLDNGNYFGYVVAYGNKTLQQVSFGANLFSTPTIINISLTILSGFTPYGIDGAYDNGTYSLFISTLEGSLIKVNLGSALSLMNANGSSMGNFSILENTLKIKLIKHKSNWFTFSPSWNTTRLYRLDFPNPSCDLEFSSVLTQISPQLSFATAGTKAITLRAFKNGGEYAERSKSILITNSQAPIIDISFNTMCVDVATTFSVNTLDAIQTYNWDFGDLSNSTQTNPSHQYAHANQYEVKLLVTATNGCNNSTSKALSIYNKPLSSFNVPSGQVCTNNEFTFVNTTSDLFDGNLSYQWKVEGLPVSTTRDLKYTFQSGGDKSIALQVSIPGCSDERAQMISNIQVGPTVEFSAVGQCQDEVVSFTNSSFGDITGYQWSFGDGQTSTELNPVYSYSDKGNYQVSLITTSSNGCSSQLIKPITIYSKPQTNFSIDLPPFSCAGSPSQFNDQTPSLTDSNITTWLWNFGDLNNGSSTQKNPTYTYVLAGDYQVSLSATTNFGCATSTQKQVTISTPPSVNFSNGIACLNQGTQFADASDPTVKAWLWSIQNSTYTTKNATHVFSTTGSLPVMLTVTGSNNCVSQMSKIVNVPIPAVPDFTALSTCAGKPTQFQEKNAGGNDPAVSWIWDFGGQGVGTGSPAEHIFPSMGSYAVKMNTTRQSGCVYSITKSVAISQAPQAQFTPSPESGGSPLTVGFTNTSSLATTYLWKFNDSNNSTSSEFSPSFIFNQLGEYPVELIARNALGCQDSFIKIVKVVVPNSNAVLSEFKLIPSGGTMKVQVTITNQGNISIANPDVIIDLSGNTFVKEKLVGIILPNQVLTRTLSIDILPKNLHYVCAEVSIVGDVYLFDNRQCLNLQIETIAIQPYPNPAQDELFIDWINPESESMRVIIYNASGQIVLEKNYEPVLLGLNQVKVNVSNLGAGIYFVSYFDGKVSRTSRFSIIR
ncbi:MAG: PKD domain-containing protein [Cyclobacteriaceae bacterium]|nr:PKD domain-containing protein [Cyclobacteriaceae bacterium]